MELLIVFYAQSLHQKKSEMTQKLVNLPVKIRRMNSTQMQVIVYRFNIDDDKTVKQLKVRNPALHHHIKSVKITVACE